MYVFETSNLAVGEIKELSNKVWKLEALNERYKHVVEKGMEIENSHLTRGHDRGKMLNSGDDEQKRNEQKRKLRSQYLGILLRDPFLPKEMLPSDWFGDKAKKLIKNL